MEESRTRTFVEGDEFESVEFVEVEFRGILETEVGISQRWKLGFWAAGCCIE